MGTLVSSPPLVLINWVIALVRDLTACSGCNHLKGLGLGYHLHLVQIGLAGGNVFSHKAAFFIPDVKHPIPRCQLNKRTFNCLLSESRLIDVQLVLKYL